VCIVCNFDLQGKVTQTLLQKNEEEKMIRLIAALALPIFLLTVGTASALRCGNNLVQVGDLKYEVILNCGEPVSTEVIGYIDRVEIDFIDNRVSEKRIRVMKIEEWILEVTNYGTTYHYSLVFDGNELKEIKPVGQKKTK
jgi:hypothetical protein